MNKTSGFLSEFKPIKYNEKTKKYIVSWGLRNINGNNYEWEYVIFNYKPSLDEIKKTINSSINLKTKNDIENNFVWNNLSINLSIENQIDYSLLLNTTIFQNGSNLPEKVKFKVNNENTYYEFETIEDMKDFVIAMNNHIRKYLQIGYGLKDNINWEDYKI